MGPIGGKKAAGTKISIRLPVAKEPPAFGSIEPIAAKPIGSEAAARRIRAVGA